MERLTERDEHGLVYLICRDGCRGGPACFECEQRAALLLAAYEDTGLAPEEVMLYKEAQEISEGMRPERLRELAQAERDGRLVVLPDNDGERKPSCFYGAKELCPGLAVITDDEPIESCKKCRWCSAGYFQLEAEAAVERMKGGGEHG